MSENGRLIVDGKGTEREVFRASFPDKKIRDWDSSQADEILIKARELVDKFEIGQKEATVKLNPEYPRLPIVISLMTDTHYGSLYANTKGMLEHLDIVRSTPNFYLVHNGDHTDNFNATGKWASGMASDPLPQQLTSRSWADKLKHLDNEGKIIALSFGNHDDFGLNAGQDWYESFLGGFKAPIFNAGGLIHINHGKEDYDLAMTHMYWGTSKLNPTNAVKRFIDFEHPNADIGFLGHTHQSEGLHFEKGGKDRIAVIGGTYKDTDDWAKKHGIGGRSGNPGWAVALWPEEHGMQLFKSIEAAEQWMQAAIFEYDRS